MVSICMEPLNRHGEYLFLSCAHKKQSLACTPNFLMHTRNFLVSTIYFLMHKKRSFSSWARKSISHSWETNLRLAKLCSQSTVSVIWLKLYFAFTAWNWLKVTLSSLSPLFADDNIRYILFPFLGRWIHPPRQPFWLRLVSLAHEILSCAHKKSISCSPESFLWSLQRKSSPCPPYIVLLVGVIKFGCNNFWN